jgi:epsin
MDMLDKRLNDKGKNWRHVLKALKVLDYCLHEGSELVVTWAMKNVYIIKTLREFQYIDEEGKDVGQNGEQWNPLCRITLTELLVRVSAKELTSLILDEERLRGERSDRKNWKSRVTGIEEFARPPQDESPRRSRPQRAQRADEEDAEYKLAIEASKHQEEEDRRKRQSRGGEPDDEDLAKALKLSREEDELRKRELEDQNAASLFDDDLIQVAQPTGFNQGYQQQPAVDWSGNPVDQNMQQQPTGYVNSYNTGYQPQQTGLPSNYSNGFGAQPAGFDPYGGQQQQLQPQPQPQQQSTYQQQPTGYNPYATTYPQPALQIPAGTNNPWANNNSQQGIQPTPTGSNNPFASSFPRSASTPAKPTLATLQEQKALTNFNSSPIYHSPTSFTPPPQDPNSHEARLNALLAGGGDGLDTFGNTGNLRIPAQHTAPGTFVNSAGVSRIHDQRTANNPFLPNQFTGMPQTTYSGNPGQQVPAATGPAGMASGFGSGYGSQQSNNPFGARQQQGQGGQDLIQF